MIDDRTLALLELALAGRPERIVESILAAEPADAGPEYRRLLETLAALGLSEAPVAPPGPLRGRVLRTLEQRKRTAKKAVLVIDMLNDHLSPGRPLEVPRAREIVPAISRRLDEARQENVPIVYVVDQHEPDDPDLEQWPAHNVKGTPGGEIWPALAPKAGDRVVTKPTYSAFTRSALESVLDELSVDTLVLTGCLTEIGVLATATRALELGFAVEVPVDAQAGASDAAEKMAMGLIALMPPYGAARKERLARLITDSSAHTGG